MNRLGRAALIAGLALAATVEVGWHCKEAAAAVPQVKAQVTATEVSVGETFVLQITALVDSNDEVPASPRLVAPAGLVIRSGPGISTQTQVSITNGRMSQKVGIACTWRIEATKAGRYRIGPASLLWGGRRIESPIVEVNVTSGGARAHRPRGGMPVDPFDLLGLPRMPSLLGGDDGIEAESPAEPETDQSLAMELAPDRSVFLRPMVNKTEGVVGEQLTLSIYQYVKTGLAEASDLHEPNTPDFLQIPLISPGEEPEPRYANVAGAVWRARLLRKVALFPLRAGQLEIGSMRATFVGFGLRGSAPRQSPPVLIHVTEPPAKGRPVGFRSGDVGSFTLSGSVEPRTVEQGGAVAVTLKLKGIGNLPATLPVPSRADVEWLEPQTHHRPEVDRDRIAGLRTFTYVVKPSKAGDIDLGEVVLPFYDPERRSYDSAKVSLGKIKVKPNAAAAQGAAKESADPFSAVGPARTTATMVRGSSRTPLSDSPWYWFMLFSPPIGVAVAGALLDSSRKVRERVQKWKGSSQRKADLGLREARSLAKEGKRAECLASLERAMHASVEAATSLRSRGILRSELEHELTQAGIGSELAERLVAWFAACEALRFEPDSEAERLEDLVQRAERIVADLPTRVRGKTR